MYLKSKFVFTPYETIARWLIEPKLKSIKILNID